jgi:hypothetical protein
LKIVAYHNNHNKDGKGKNQYAGFQYHQSVNVVMLLSMLSVMNVVGVVISWYHSYSYFPSWCKMYLK